MLISFRGQVLTHQHILREVWDAGRQNETYYLRMLVGQLRHSLVMTLRVRDLL